LEVRCGDRARIARVPSTFLLLMHHTSSERADRQSPINVPSWLEERLLCPACRGPLQRAARRREGGGASADGWACRNCARHYPLRYGIPDFRLAPDPYITVGRESFKVDRLLDVPGRSFAELLEAYYALSPENPPSLHAGYVAAMELAVERGAALLRALDRLQPPRTHGTLLDLGCGTGGMTVAATRSWERVVGVDVALRWLVMGRRRLEERGVRAPLVCANAEALPFRADAFDAVAADAVLEHVRQSARMRDEMLRVLAPGGSFLLTTNNRYSILPEPHVRLPGFGWLPRELMESVAWRVRKTPYKTRLHSRRELERLFAGVGRVALRSFEPGELGPAREGMRRWWERLTSVAPGQLLMHHLAPMYTITGAKPAAR
jgi:SAM-dependent methyltransferase